jgi:hypothetical protein
MRMFRVATWLAISSILSGCAYVTAVPAPPGSNVEGIRIYDAKPILIVTETTTTVSLIPNYNRAYALKFGTFLAKNNVDVEWSSTGFLSKLSSDQDTTAVVDLLKQAVQTFGPALTGTAHAAQEGGGASSRFGVYEFIFDDEGNLKGLRPLLREGDLGPRPPKPRIPVTTPQAPPPNPNTPVVR